MRHWFFVLAALVCAATFTGCGTDMVVTAPTDNAVVTTSQAASQPFMPGAAEQPANIAGTYTLTRDRTIQNTLTASSATAPDDSTVVFGPNPPPPPPPPPSPPPKKTTWSAIKAG